MNLAAVKTEIAAAFKEHRAELSELSVWDRAAVYILGYPTSFAILMGVVTILLVLGLILLLAGIIIFLQMIYEACWFGKSLSKEESPTPEKREELDAFARGYAQALRDVETYRKRGIS